MVGRVDSGPYVPYAITDLFNMSSGTRGYHKITQIEENNGTALYNIRMERICLGCLYSYQYIFPIEPFPHTCIQCISCRQIIIFPPSP